MAGKGWLTSRFCGTGVSSVRGSTGDPTARSREVSWLDEPGHVDQLPNAIGSVGLTVLLSDFCHQLTSCHAPSLNPTPRYVPTGSNPTDRWSATLASFGSAMPANVSQYPSRTSSVKSSS